MHYLVFSTTDIDLLDVPHLPDLRARGRDPLLQADLMMCCDILRLLYQNPHVRGRDPQGLIRHSLRCSAFQQQMQ